VASNLLGNSKHWLDCAEEARALAEHMHDAWARTAMLTTAWGYERLARHAERHATDDLLPRGAVGGGIDLRDRPGIRPPDTF